MRSYAPTRRDALQAAVYSSIAFSTLSASMKILGSPASAQPSQKIIMGTRSQRLSAPISGRSISLKKMASTSSGRALSPGPR
jgi:hypothetical protein